MRSWRAGGEVGERAVRGKVCWAGGTGWGVLGSGTRTPRGLHGGRPPPGLGGTKRGAPPAGGGRGGPHRLSLSLPLFPPSFPVLLFSLIGAPNSGLGRGLGGGWGGEPRSQRSPSTPAATPSPGSSRRPSPCVLFHAAILLPQTPGLVRGLGASPLDSFGASKPHPHSQPHATAIITLLTHLASTLTPARTDMAPVCS